MATSKGSSYLLGYIWLARLHKVHRNFIARNMSILTHHENHLFSACSAMGATFGDLSFHHRRYSVAFRRVSVNGRDGLNVVAKRLNLRMRSIHTRTLNV